MMSSLRWVGVDWNVSIHVGMMSTIIEAFPRILVPKSLVPINSLSKCTEPKIVSVQVVELFPKETNTIGHPPIPSGTYAK
jgi:hypothetical protein